MILEWSTSEQRFWYLSKEDSQLYLQVRESISEKDKIIKRLIEEKAAASHAAHCRETY